MHSVARLAARVKRDEKPACGFGVFYEILNKQMR